MLCKVPCGWVSLPLSRASPGGLLGQHVCIGDNKALEQAPLLLSAVRQRQEGGQRRSERDLAAQEGAAHVPSSQALVYVPVKLRVRDRQLQGACGEEEQSY